MFRKKKVEKKTDCAIGVDIGNFAVKVAQLRKQPDGMEFQSFGYAKIDPGRVNGPVEAIKEACTQAKITGKNVNAAITPEGVIVRYLLLPEMSDDDLRRAMEFEIDRYVPFDRKEVVSDYTVLEERIDGKNMKVLMVAAKRKVVDHRVKILKAAGLEPEVMTIDSIVLKNVFESNYPDKKEKTVGLINVGSKISNINIVRNSVSCFMRDVQLGGDNITQLLKEKLEIAADEAEKSKCTIAPDDKERFKIVEPVLGNLLNEVYLSFDYYESEFGMVVDEVLISGGTAQLGLLASFLKENLKRDITVVNPFAKITIGPSVAKDRLRDFSSSLVVSVGLAIESFV